MTQTILRLVMADHLSHALLPDPREKVLMVEVLEEARSAPHHRQKLVFLFSAMRHFAQELRARGFVVDYIALDDPENTHNFTAELARAIARHRPDHLRLTAPSEYRVAQMAQDWQTRFGAQILEDTRFFVSPEGFLRLRAAGKTGRLEYFYREMRRRSGLLMQGDKPEGGQWNFDAENRRALPKGHRPPARLRFAPDALTEQVIALVKTHFPHNFGEVEPFGWAVEAQGAKAALDHFITHALPEFGTYQDAMKTGEDFLYHSLISPYLNAGLLTAQECCAAAEAAYRAGQAPLNAVEGFIRQILGWREFVRGLYWAEMPEYTLRNGLDAARALPAFYWTGKTDLRCMAECIGTTKRHGYAHHIQRLMVLGNFAALIGAAPAEVQEWYLAVYLDAFEWVEAPNVQGMILHADGGRLGSKPYVASGAYINRMSDYCKSCAYDVKARLGAKACPFNALYWDFLARHAARFGANPRMSLPYKTLRAMSAEERQAIRAQAEGFLASLQGWDAPKTPQAPQLSFDL